MAGVPTLLWKLLEEVSPGDRVAMQRTAPQALGNWDDDAQAAALLAGAFVSEGWFSETRGGFNNTDPKYFEWVLDAYDRVVGGTRYVSSRTIKSGSVLHEIDVQDLASARRSRLAGMIGHRSADKSVPEFVWRGSTAVKTTFLQSLFTGDGSSSMLARSTLQVTYSTRSQQLADEVQLLLLEQGVVASQCHYDNGEIKLVIGGRRNVRAFAWNVGFLGVKRDKLNEHLSSVPLHSEGTQWRPRARSRGVPACARGALAD